MKITNKAYEEYAFDNLYNGDVFKFAANDANFYMKTVSVGDYYYNTVQLSNGDMIHTDKDHVIIPVDCELIVK